MIECQGKQHYEPVERFGGQKTFESQQRKDAIKRAFCQRYNLSLLEIPYWEKDVEGVVRDFVSGRGRV